MKEELLMKLIEKLLDCEPTEPPAVSVKSGLDHIHVGEYVLIRTYSAGVHFGLLKARSGKEALLDEARRIWSWEGAFTLSKVAADGVGGGKLSVAIDGFLVTEVIEIIRLSDSAKANLYGITPHA